MSRLSHQVKNVNSPGATPEALRWAEVAALQGEQPTGRGFVLFGVVFHTLG